MEPRFVTAASFVPSAEEVMDSQPYGLFVFGLVEVFGASFQVSPESVEV